MDEGSDVESGGPFTDLLVVKLVEGLGPEVWRLVWARISRIELWPRFGVGEVEAAFSSDEELTTDGWLVVAERGGDACGGGDFGGPKSGRATADDKDMGSDSVN